MYQYPAQATISRNYNIPVNKIIICILLTIILLIALTIMILNIKIYKINGTSMNPTLIEKEYVMTYKSNKYERKDIIAFHHNNAIMIKRIIGLPGETIDITNDGTVLVNGQVLEEAYLSSKDLGEPEITFPYTIPADTYFVLGDNRKDSLDSRIASIGCIKKYDIVGIVKYSVIPFKKIE